MGQLTMHKEKLFSFMRALTGDRDQVLLYPDKEYTRHRSRASSIYNNLALSKSWSTDFLEYLIN